MDIHHTDLRLALGLVMATVSIGLLVSASHPTVTSDARETGDRPTHWPGLLYKNPSKEATSGRTPSYNIAVIECQIRRGILEPNMHERLPIEWPAAA